MTATRGRIAVGSLAVREGGSVRSTIASPAYAGSWILPVAGGSGGGIVSLLVPGDLGVRFGGTLLQRQEDAQTAGNLTVVRQGGTSAVSAPVSTVGASAVIMAIAGEGVMGAGLREAGAGPDDASTGRHRDAGARAGSCCRRPSAAPRVPALVLANPGDAPVTVTASPAERGHGHGLDHGPAAADRGRARSASSTGTRRRGC